jgi:hypothetical protein
MWTIGIYLLVSANGEICHIHYRKQADSFHFQKKKKKYKNIQLFKKKIEQ